MIRAVIFDFNGVLVDDEHLHFALFREVLAGEGIELTERDYHEEFLGLDDRGCFEEALRRAGRRADRADLDALIVRKALRYEQEAGEGLRFFPGAAECLAAMADRWPVAINSGALRAEIELALRWMGVAGRVEAIISAEDAGRCKPDPEGYFLALDALRSAGHDGLEAGHCLVVEDSLAGIQSAKGAGMWAVGIAATYPEDALRAAGADAVLGTIAALSPRWVDRFFAPEVSP